MYEEKRSLKKKKQKEKFIRIFWWTLLIHAIIFLVILDIAFKETPKIFLPKKPPPNLAQIPENELPASLKPRKSIFGGTVLFDDKAGFKPPQSKLLALDEQPGEDNIQGPSQKSIPQKKSPELLSEKKESTPATTETLKNKPVEKKEVIKKNESKKKKPKKQTLIEDKKNKIADRNISEEIKKESSDVKATMEDKMADELQKRIEDIAKKQALVSQAQHLQDSPNHEASPLPKITKIRTPGTSQKDKAPIKVSRKSIVSMTKGFIENLKDKGEDWLKRKGDDNKRPSFEELKYISYEERIQWHLQNIWKQGMETTIKGTAIIGFKIKENGDVIDIEIVQSSGCAKVDNLIIRNIELASPFPPVPKHFNEKIYQSGRVFKINT